MKRLTDKRMKGEGFIPVDPKEYKAFIRNEKPTGKQIYQHLLEVEDILGDDYDLDRLRELVEADREGRCVVLPCKVGSPVWRIYDDCEFPGDCGTKQKCSGCEYRNLFVEEQAFCLSMLSQNGKLSYPYFATPEDAEAVLKYQKGE